MNKPTIKPTAIASYDQGKAALELTDHLYSYAEAFGYNQDWVQEKYEEIRYETLKKTGIDINEA